MFNLLHAIVWDNEDEEPDEPGFFAGERKTGSCYKLTYGVAFEDGAVRLIDTLENCRKFVEDRGTGMVVKCYEEWDVEFRRGSWRHV